MRGAEQTARSRLRRFRQGSLLAVALTALLVVLFGLGDEAAGQTGDPAAARAAERDPLDGLPSDPFDALEQATGTVRDLLRATIALFPRLGIALLLVPLAWAVARLVAAVVGRSLKAWEKAEAAAALARIGVYLLTGVAVLSILAGDVRALLGSVGLIGLALSWALQTPIESFTGWLLNSFRSYYRVGDRIEVGEVFGDVYRIDLLTTTVWEAGGADKAVAGAQPTGALVTFPNWEVLRSNIINYSRDFPYVWDEVVLSLGDQTDLGYVKDLFERVAAGVLGGSMGDRVESYMRLLAVQGLAFEIEPEPRVFFATHETWIDCTVRYLVHARRRRGVATELTMALIGESHRAEHHGRIFPGYPRREQFVRGGRADEPAG
jgi:small-conductance mechanosensitive channel